MIPIYYLEIATGNLYQGACQPGDRIATDEEVADYLNSQDVLESKQAILAQLDEIDRKSIRALRCGETDRLAELEAQAVILRQQL